MIAETEDDLIKRLNEWKDKGKGKGKGKKCIAVHKQPHHYGNSRAIWDHRVLPAEVTFPPLFQPVKAGTSSSDPEGMQS